MVDKIYDIRGLYEHVSCNGEHFIRTFDQRKISRVTSIEFAGIFEIGRMMLAYGVSA